MDFNKLHKQLKEVSIGLNEENYEDLVATFGADDDKPNYIHEPIEDEFELIRNALREYSEQDDCFLEGYVTIEDIKNNYGLQDFTDSMIIECAKEEGYEVDGDKILDPCAE